jgi:hypothetical protein
VNNPTLGEILSEGEHFGSHWRDVDRVAVLVNAGGVLVERIELPISPPYSECSESEWTFIECEFSGRTSEHKHLCHSAALWLESRGTAWTADIGGLYYEGGTADVAAADGSIVVECGWTQARKIEAAIAGGRLIMVVPYLDDRKYGDTPLGFIFRVVDRTITDETLKQIRDPEHRAQIKALENDSIDDD